MESRLVDALRDARLLTLSLVAEADGLVIGDAAFSPMTFAGPDAGLKAAGLGPLAVLPEYQGIGAGSALTRRGIDLCREAGFDLLAVYGSPVYYSRFGFVLAGRLNLHPGDAGIELQYFQALMLRGTPPEEPSRIRYAPQFFLA